MPELPEVQTVVDTLRDRVLCRAVTEVPHVRTDMVTPPGFDLAAALAGRTIVSLHRRAKRIVFGFDDHTRMYVHLGMTGQLTLDDPAAPRKPHTHLVAQLDTGRELRLVDPRRFGGIVWMGLSNRHANIGPEPLTLRPAALHRRLLRTRRPVKVALLDQALVAGIGNIYADEALHLAGISPANPASELTEADARRLSRGIKHVLRKAIRAGGSSIRDYVDGDGQRGGYQTAHRVYGREGKPCATCRRLIVRVVLGGRSTHFCPKCQAGR
jgi:formamidopyrimidine-DNA glycosylase